MRDLVWDDELGEFVSVEADDDEANQFLASIGRGPLHDKRQELAQAMYNLLRQDLRYADYDIYPWHHHPEDFTN